MCAGGCSGGGGGTVRTSIAAVALAQQPQSVVEYIGSRITSMTYSVDGVRLLFGNNRFHKKQSVTSRIATKLLSTYSDEFKIL